MNFRKGSRKMAKRKIDPRQGELINPGPPKPSYCWHLLTRDSTGRIRGKPQRSLNDCYEELYRQRQLYEITASEILGPRAGKYRVIDGEVWAKRLLKRNRRDKVDAV